MGSSGFFPLEGQLPKFCPFPVSRSFERMRRIMKGCHWEPGSPSGVGTLRSVNWRPISAVGQFAAADDLTFFGLINAPGGSPFPDFFPLPFSQKTEEQPGNAPDDRIFQYFLDTKKLNIVMLHFFYSNVP